MEKYSIYLTNNYFLCIVRQPTLPHDILYLTKSNCEMIIDLNVKNLLIRFSEKINLTIHSLSIFFHFLSLAVSSM